MKNLNIREFTAKDKSAVEDFSGGLMDFERELHRSRNNGAKVKEKHFQHLKKKVDKNRGIIYIAEIEAEIVGSVIAYVIKEEAEDKHVIEEYEEYGYIHELFVKEGFRGKGIGRELITKTEEYFKRLRIGIVKIAYLYPNHRAGRIYREIGYEGYEVLLDKRI